jgi:hypothetical protein
MNIQGFKTPRPFDAMGLKSDSNIPPFKITFMDKICSNCDALLFPSEINKATNSGTICCANGKIDIPLINQPDTEYIKLLCDNGFKGKSFRLNIRAYNSALSFASMQCNYDSILGSSRDGVYVFKISGHIYHNIGSLFPNSDTASRNAQIYFTESIARIDKLLSDFKTLDREALNICNAVPNRKNNPYLLQIISAILYTTSKF